MYKVLLFDFDGTIADSFESFLEIISKLSIKHNLQQVPRSELEKLRGEEPRAIIKRLKIPFYKIPFLARDMKKMQYEHIAQIKSFKALPEVLHTLKSMGYKLGIITSNGKENIELFTKNNDIAIFDYIYTDTSMFGKDRMIRKFLTQHAVPKDQVLYVGDEIRDIQACQKVGMKIAAVTWGFNTVDGIKKYKPNYLINSPEELLQIVNN
jgi:phosphoglycolate phosphatase